jgi:hypothetical protein
MNCQGTMVIQCSCGGEYIADNSSAIDHFRSDLHQKWNEWDEARTKQPAQPKELKQPKQSKLLKITQRMEILVPNWLSDCITGAFTHTDFILPGSGYDDMVLFNPIRKMLDSFILWLRRNNDNTSVSESVFAMAVRPLLGSSVIKKSGGRRLRGYSYSERILKALLIDHSGDSNLFA